MDKSPQSQQNDKMPNETYKELTIFERPYIEEIVRMVKGPYPPFHKRIKLRQMVELLNEIWEDDGIW